MMIRNSEHNTTECKIISSMHQLDCTAPRVYAVPEGAEAIKCTSEEVERHHFLELKIPASVTTIDGLAYLSNCNNITVDPENPVFCSIDGVVFSKDRKVLVAYPQAKLPSAAKNISYTYRVPVGTTRIADCAFAFNRTLKEIIIPDSVEYIGSLAFSNCLDLFDISLPASVSYIGAHCFVNSNRLNRLSFPPHLNPLFSSNLSNGITIEIPDGVALEVDSVPEGFPVFGLFAGKSFSVKPILLCKNNSAVKHFASESGFQCIAAYTIDSDKIVWADNTLLCFPSHWASDRYQLPKSTKQVYSCAFSATSLSYVWSYKKIPLFPLFYELMDYIMPSSRKPGRKKALSLKPGNLPLFAYLPEDDPLNFSSATPRQSTWDTDDDSDDLDC